MPYYGVDVKIDSITNGWPKVLDMPMVHCMSKGPIVQEHLILGHSYLVLFPSFLCENDLARPLVSKKSEPILKKALPTNSKKAISIGHDTHDHIPITKGGKTLGYENILMSMVKKHELFTNIFQYN